MNPLNTIRGTIIGGVVLAVVIGLVTFGVRAIDNEGNRSQVTYPRPQARTRPAAPTSTASP